MSDPDSISSRFELRYMQRQGILPPTPLADDAVGLGAEQMPPRAGTLRRPPSEDMPAGMGFLEQPVSTPPARAVGSELLGSIARTWMAASQGVSEGALETAQPVEDAAVRSILDPSWNDGGDVRERLRAARERADSLGVNIAFRDTPDGGVEAVQISPDADVPGGRVGRMADALGRVLGLGMVDGVQGVRAPVRAVRKAEGAAR